MKAGDRVDPVTAVTLLKYTKTWRLAGINRSCSPAYDCIVETALPSIQDHITNSISTAKADHRSLHVEHMSFAAGVGRTLVTCIKSHRDTQEATAPGNSAVQ